MIKYLVSSRNTEVQEARIQKGGGGGAVTPQPKLQYKKKSDFCSHDDINGFTWFALQPKSATTILQM